MIRRLGQPHYVSVQSRLDSSATASPSTLTRRRPTSEHDAEENGSSSFDDDFRTPTPVADPIPARTAAGLTSELLQAIPPEQTLAEDRIEAIVQFVCRKLSNMVELIGELSTDIAEERAPAELCDELRLQLLPLLVNLDLDMGAAERALAYNVDRTGIGETKAGRLLRFQTFMNELRRVFVELSGRVLDELADCLDIQRRGCRGKTPAKWCCDQIDDMKRGMLTARQLIRI